MGSLYSGIRIQSSEYGTYKETSVPSSPPPIITEFRNSRQLTPTRSVRSSVSLPSFEVRPSDLIYNFKMFDSDSVEPGGESRVFTGYGVISGYGTWRTSHNRGWREFDTLCEASKSYYTNASSGLGVEVARSPMNQCLVREKVEVAGRTERQFLTFCEKGV
ncbi:hypothetical protein BDZ94DRAFT_1243938 [Collybia nuda]|uniref:Uncharacterized protein n=1 Tax=Collybia nuda TaxID=64659 RepID=A0A9P5YFW1_9AGAR|nr:hypothetical protein BDZ94DRAFT_1243938 [Collybia nuda]